MTRRLLDIAAIAALAISVASILHSCSQHEQPVELKEPTINLDDIYPPMGNDK